MKTRLSVLLLTSLFLSGCGATAAPTATLVESTPTALAPQEPTSTVSIVTPTLDIATILVTEPSATAESTMTPQATATATPTTTITATGASTQTFTPTTPAPAPFAGSWTMIVAGSSPNVNITQNGNIISGSFKIGGGNIITFTGTLSSDSKTVTGTFTQSAGEAGDFVWYVFNNLMQFNGHGAVGGVPFEWCGYRAGQSAPVPCQAT